MDWSHNPNQTMYNKTESICYVAQPKKFACHIRADLKISLSTYIIPTPGFLCGPNLFYIMTSSNGNIFRVTGPLCGEFTGHRTKASDVELSCILLSAPE